MGLKPMELHSKHMNSDRQVTDYILSQRKLGKKQEDIKNSLVSAGWQVSDAEHAILSAMNLTVLGNGETVQKIPYQSGMVVVVNANTQPGAISVKADAPKSLIHTSIIIWYWIFVAFTLVKAVKGGLVLSTMNNAQTQIPGYLDFEFLKTMPLLPLLAIINPLSFIVLLYTSLKLSVFSKKAWNIAFITLIVLQLVGFIVGAYTAASLQNLASQLQSF